MTPGRSRSIFGLVSSWIAWWIVLAAWKLGPALPALLRVSREGGHGSANVSFGDGAISASITEGMTVAWQGNISFLALVLLIGVPPLILWALWLRTRKRPDAPESIGEGPAENVTVKSGAGDRAGGER